jgi:hypothetical protein
VPAVGITYPFKLQSSAPRLLSNKLDILRKESPPPHSHTHTLCLSLNVAFYLKEYALLATLCRALIIPASSSNYPLRGLGDCIGFPGIAIIADSPGELVHPATSATSSAIQRGQIYGGRRRKGSGSLSYGIVSFVKC